MMCLSIVHSSLAGGGARFASTGGRKPDVVGWFPTAAATAKLEADARRRPTAGYELIFVVSSMPG
jgi:hypothetical protein